MSIKCAQYRAYDFVKLGNFSYSQQIKPNNLNLGLFCYGSLRHLLALNDGTLPKVSPQEYNSRLQHLINVLEIALLGSGLNDYDSPAWRVSRDYNEKIVKDVEFGIKSFEFLSKSIDPMAWTLAKELQKPSKSNPQNGKSNVSNNGTQKMCTTWNSFRNEGCQWEHSHPGESCVYQHICSFCKGKGLSRKHKFWQCLEKDKESSRQAPAPSAQTSAPVTSA